VELSLPLHLAVQDIGVVTLMRQLMRSLPHVQVQRKAANAAQEQRKALMGAGDYMQRAQQLKTQQDLTNSAADTTVSLQRTRQLMAEVYNTPCMPTSPASETQKACI